MGRGPFFFCIHIPCFRNCYPSPIFHYTSNISEPFKVNCCNKENWESLPWNSEPKTFQLPNIKVKLFNTLNNQIQFRISSDTPTCAHRHTSFPGFSSQTTPTMTDPPDPTSLPSHSPSLWWGTHWIKNCCSLAWSTFWSCPICSCCTTTRWRMTQKTADEVPKSLLHLPQGWHSTKAFRKKVNFYHYRSTHLFPK